MKRIEVGSQKPNFIGCWDIDNKNLCNEIVSFFEGNKDLSKEGTTTLGKNIKIKKTTDITINPNNQEMNHGYGVLLLKLNQHVKGLGYIRKGTGFIRFSSESYKII